MTRTTQAQTRLARTIGTIAGLVALLLLAPATASAATTSISGTAYAGAGSDRPAAGACVTLYDQVVANATDVARVTTATDGTWSADVPVGGPYVVEVGCRSDAPTQYYGGAWRAEDATPVAVAAGRPTTGVDVHLLPFGSISGTVSLPDGSPAAAGHICVRAFVWRGYDFGPDPAPAPVDGAGHYTIGALRPGPYHVVAAACPEADDDVLVTFAPATTSPDDASDLAVVPGSALTAVDVRVTLGTSIRGRVFLGPGTDHPVAGACAAALPVDSTETTAYVVSEPTGPDGSYVLRPLPPVPSGYRVRVDDCSGGARRFGDTYASYPQVAHPAIGAPTEDYDAHAATSATLDVAVLDADGAPITGARACVSAFPNPDGRRSDDRGHVILDGLGAGTLEIFASDCRGVTDRDDLGRSLHVTLAAGEQKSITVRLDAGTSLAGSVRGTADGGFGLQDDCVTAERAGGDDPYVILQPTRATVAADGAYRIGHLVPGAGYRVRFSACGAWQHPDQWFDGVSDAALARVVTPTLGAPATGIDARFDVGPRPPVTTLLSWPASPDGAPDPTFTFDTDVAGATSECRLDDGPWIPCRSPWRAPTGRLGTHDATIRSTNAGVVGQPTRAVRWERGSRVLRSSEGERPAGGTFSPEGTLAPDAVHPVTITLRTPRAAHLTTTVSDQRDADPATYWTQAPSGRSQVAATAGFAARGPDSLVWPFPPSDEQPASPADPYVLTVTYAAAGLSPGVRAGDVTIATSQRTTPDAGLVAPCTGATVPSMGTCLADRRTLADGSLRVTVRTSMPDQTLLAIGPAAAASGSRPSPETDARPATSSATASTPTATTSPAPGSRSASDATADGAGSARATLRIMSARTVSVSRLVGSGLAVGLRAATAGQATAQLLSRRAGRTAVLASGRSPVSTRRRTLHLRATRRAVARLAAGPHIALTLRVRVRSPSGRMTTAVRRITATR